MNRENYRYGLMFWWLSEVATDRDIERVQKSANGKTLSILGFAADRRIAGIRDGFSLVAGHSDKASGLSDLYVLLLDQLVGATSRTIWNPYRIPSLPSSLKAVSLGCGIEDVQLFDPWIATAVSVLGSSSRQAPVLESVAELSTMLRDKLDELVSDPSTPAEVIDLRLFEFMAHDKVFRATLASLIEPISVSWCHKLFISELLDAADTPENRSAYLLWAADRDLNDFGVESLPHPVSDEPF